MIYFKGLIHFTRGNRAKAASVDISWQPCCSASAAKWASRHEVAMRLAVREHLLKHEPMAIGWFNQQSTGLV